VSKKAPIVTAHAPGAVGPYSQGVQAGPYVFVSGQIPLDPKTKAFVPGGVAEQTERCLLNVRAVLAEAGLIMDDVVKVTVFMTDLSQFDAMNAVYAKHFKAPFPARAAVQVSALPKGALVEIDAIGLKP
jgi:2-iminobutanoate/2-iminopropanoate deaminase